MILSRPRNIPAAIGQVGSKHCLQPCHFLATSATCESLGIYLALLGDWVEKFTPGIQVYDKIAAIYRLLMTTQPAFGALLLPTLTHNRPPRSWRQGPFAPSGAQGEGWKVL